MTRREAATTANSYPDRIWLVGDFGFGQVSWTPDDCEDDGPDRVEYIRADRAGAAERAVAAFNADDTQTRYSNPDSREHRHARLPILCADCDYEIVSFSGVQGVRL